jgi:subtilase family serine protease
MKRFAQVLAFAIAATSCMAQSPANPVVLPDLVCKIRKSGNEIVFTVHNTSPDSKRCARSGATLLMNGVTQNISVPELDPEGTFEKRIPVPASLQASSFTVTGKVDVAGKINETNESNNTLTITLNQPDLRPVLFPGNQTLKTRSDNQFLYFSVKNAGDGNAGTSVAQFTYYLADGKKLPIQVNTPALNAGQEIELRISPNICPSMPSSGDCRHEVEVDFGKTVKESSETNNRASGVIEG